jgi:hypothetical protein
MATYRVQVRVDFDYEVEVNDRDEAIAQGWNWEDYTHWASVYNIEVEDITEPEEEDNA